jgi:hypothetical protein
MRQYGAPLYLGHGLTKPQSQIPLPFYKRKCLPLCIYHFGMAQKTMVSAFSGKLQP